MLLFPVCVSRSHLSHNFLCRLSHGRRSGAVAKIPAAGMNEQTIHTLVAKIRNAISLSVVLNADRFVHRSYSQKALLFFFHQPIQVICLYFHLLDRILAKEILFNGD